MGQPSRQLSLPNLDLRHIQDHFGFTFRWLRCPGFQEIFHPLFSSQPPIPEAFLTLPVISRPSSNMGQKHGSGGFPLPRQKPTPIPRCRDCTIAFRNCKSFLPKRNCRRMVSTDTTRRQLTIRSNQISGNLTLLTNQFATNAVRASAVSLDFSSPAVCAISAAIASLPQCQVVNSKKDKHYQRKQSFIVLVLFLFMFSALHCSKRRTIIYSMEVRNGLYDIERGR